MESATRTTIRSHGRITWLILAAIVLVAIFPRVLAIGDAWIWIDEDLTWLVTDGMLEEGRPVMPSGTLYPRAPLYTSLVSASLWFGERVSDLSEWQAQITALRYPSVLFSLALIVVMFLFGRSLGGDVVGLLAALMVALSPWDVHYARMARMYELFALLFTLTVYLAYLGLMRGNRAARIGMLVVAPLAIASHQQAATMAIIFVVPFLFPRDRRPPVRWLLAGLAVCVVAFVGIGRLADYGFGQSAELKVESGRSDGGTCNIAGIVIDLNHARLLLLETFERKPIAAILAALGIVGIGGWSIRRTLKDGNVASAAFAGLVVVALLANQLVIAAVLALVSIKLGERTVSGGIRRGLEFGLLAGASIVLVLGAFAWAHGLAETGDRMVLRSFAALPVPWYKRLFQTYPLMFVVTFAGIAVYFLRSLRPGADHGRLFVAAAFAAPLIGQGIVYSPYFGFRYNFYLSPLMILIFLVSTVPIVRLLTDAITPRSRRLLVATTMMGVVLVLFGEAFRPLEAFAVHRRGPGYNRELFRHPDLTASYNYDFHKTSRYVIDHREPGDIVIARDPVNLYPYGLSSTHVVSSGYDGLSKNRAGEHVDWYLGIPYIGDVETLARVLNENADVTRWIVYTTSIGPDGPHTNLPHRVLDYLTALRESHPPVATGTDSTTLVLAIPAGEPVPDPDEPSATGEAQASTSDPLSSDR
jgi:hypothetical protein